MLMLKLGFKLDKLIISEVLSAFFYFFFYFCSFSILLINVLPPTSYFVCVFFYLSLKTLQDVDVCESETSGQTSLSRSAILSPSTSIHV